LEAKVKQQNWIDVPIEQQKWRWVEYNLTAKCACGKDVEMWDGDLDSNDDCLACECGRVYSVRLVCQEADMTLEELERLYNDDFFHAMELKKKLN